MKKVDKPFATINYNGYIYTIIKKQIIYVQIQCFF